MRRRTFLATLGSLSLAGCAKSESPWGYDAPEPVTPLPPEELFESPVAPRPPEAASGPTAFEPAPSGAAACDKIRFRYFGSWRNLYDRSFTVHEFSMTDFSPPGERRTGTLIAARVALRNIGNEAFMFDSPAYAGWTVFERDSPVAHLTTGSVSAFGQRYDLSAITDLALADDSRGQFAVIEPGDDDELLVGRFLAGEDRPAASEGREVFQIVRASRYGPQTIWHSPMWRPDRDPYCELRGYRG